MARYDSANTIISRAMVEVGLTPASDPVSATDDDSIQFKNLLDGAGQELVNLYEWQQLMQDFRFVTVQGESGNYDLPDDFNRFINQTGWDHTNQVPIGGPLTPQDWAYFDGRDLVSQNIYASYRLDDDQLRLFPQPVQGGLDVNFEYISRYWVREQGSTIRRDRVGVGSDIVYYDPILIIKFLKCKWLEAKGMDASSARLEFDNAFQARTGQNKGARRLNAARTRRGINYIDPWTNAPDSFYGDWNA